jgi:hypothetical protein
MLLLFLRFLIYPYVVVDVVVEIGALVIYFAAAGINSFLLLTRVYDQRSRCSLGGRGEAVPEKLFM